MIESHLKKLRARDTISAEEEAAIRSAIVEIREFSEDVEVVHHGQYVTEAMILLEGWMARTKNMADGHQQISELQFCGDYLDMHGFTLKRLDHNVMTITPSRVAVVSHENFAALIERFPHLGRVYWMMNNIDASIHREWTASLGQRSALERMAHLFCEIYERLNLVGQTQGTSYDFPLTQQELAECLGVTPVHVNRTLQALRKQKVVDVARGRVTIPNLKALQAVGEFDPEYLYLEKRPR